MSTQMYSFYYPGQEFIQSAQDFSALMNHLTEALKQYSEIMKEVSENAVKSGAVHDAAAAFLSRTKILLDYTEGIGQKYQSLVLDMKERVSNTDHFLYASHESKRDYTVDMYRDLMDCLDHPWCKLTDDIGDWAVDTINKGFKIIGIDLVDTFRKHSHKMLLDYYDTTREDINVLFDAEQSIDLDFGKNDTGKFAGIEKVLAKISDIIRIMAEIIDPTKGNFTTANISRKLDGKFNALKKDFEKTMAISELDTPLEVDDIARFVEIRFAEHFFLSFDSRAGMFVSGLNGWDAAGMVVFQMFGIAEKTVLEGDYNTYAFKKQIMSMLEDYVENNRYSDYGLDDDVDRMRGGVKYVKKGMKEGYKYLNEHRLDNGKKIIDGRTEVAKEWNSTVKSLDTAGKILKYGDEAADFISRVSADYTAGLEYLESLKSNYDGNPKLQQAIEEIEKLYNKEMGEWSKEFLKKAGELGVDALKEFAKKNPVVAVLDKIEKGIDTAGAVTGLGTQAKETYNALTCYNLNTDLDIAYKNAIEKFRNADPSDENYAALADDVSNCFELRKKNTIDMFEHMAEASFGEEKAYYNYCRMEAEKATMRDLTGPNLISYDEYLKVYGGGRF